ncbi:MAG: M56 family metallopeptidase [Chloroflexia bacterium]|nr:M56 family metallopeptidase [Chloroflexia bacterium]
MFYCKETLPPFLFTLCFVNQRAVSANDLQQILAHEKVHIRQNHSLDLLLAHGLSVLLWFNPFAWLLQKAIKTTHEYIADRKVVDQGFELIDYQSLLLSQLISIRSVELVNNFNLISIKKRIAMMTKNDSGLASKFKAIVIIPFALALFFVFTDMTIKGSGRMLANYYDWEILDEDFQLEGLWQSKHADSQEEFILFEGSKLFVLEKGNMLREYKYQFKDNKLFVKFGSGEAIPLKFKKAGNEIAIWWNQNVFYNICKNRPIKHFRM